jgi:hypothetical protein
MMKDFLLELEIVLNGIDGKILDNNSVTSMRKASTEDLRPMVGVTLNTLTGSPKSKEGLRLYRSKSNEKGWF